MKGKEDVTKTILDAIKELTAVKLHPAAKPIPSFVFNSACNSDLNSPTSIEKPEPGNERLMQEVNSNNLDREEPPQNKKERRSLQDQLEKVKKKKEE